MLGMKRIMIIFIVGKLSKTMGGLKLSSLADEDLVFPALQADLPFVFLIEGKKNSV